MRVLSSWWYLPGDIKEVTTSSTDTTGLKVSTLLDGAGVTPILS